MKSTQDHFNILIMSNKTKILSELSKIAVEAISSFSELKKEIETNHAMSLGMLSRMAEQARLQDREIEHRTLQNAAQRIGCFVLRMAQHYQEVPVTLQLPYEKILIAKKLGMQPETFSRALKKLQDQTNVVVRGDTIEINSFDSLTNYSCVVCSSEFECDDL